MLTCYLAITIRYLLLPINRRFGLYLKLEYPPVSTRYLGICFNCSMIRFNHSKTYLGRHFAFTFDSGFPRLQSLFFCTAAARAAARSASAAASEAGSSDASFLLLLFFLLDQVKFLYFNRTFFLGDQVIWLFYTVEQPQC